MKKIVSVLCLLFLVSNSFAQSIDVKWSDQLQYDNKLDGFFDLYLGTNNNYIYAKFSNLAINPKKNNKKVKILAFDKNTMKKVGDSELKGYSGSAKESELDYYKSIILNDIIYVLWTKKAKNTIELYAQSFDAKLKRVNKLKKVYEVSTAKGAVEKLVVIYNKDHNNSILIVKEFPVAKDGDNLKIEYKLMGSDFNFVSAKQVTLPITITKRRMGIFGGGSDNFNNNICGYEFGDDGNLYVQETIKMSDEEKQNLKRGETSSYTEIMQIQLESGNLEEFRLKFPRKNTFNFSSIVTKDGVKLYGFFSDLDKDEKGRDTHGTFYISLDNKTFKVKETKFSYFDKAFLDVLYAADKENQKKGKGLFKGKKAKESDNESIDDNYVIEQVIADGSDIVLFCSIMRNWERTVCTSSGNGQQTCRTYYYCTKSNVTSFKLNSAGDIVWAKNLDRQITYERWNVYDVSVVKQDNSYYVVYGSAFQANATKKNRRSKKSSSQMVDRLEYAVFASSNGDYKKNEYQVNGLSVKSKDKKFIKQSEIDVFDNKMYTNCAKNKLKPTTFIACLCPPVFYVLLMSGNSKKGTGYLGTIEPLRK